MPSATLRRLAAVFAVAASSGAFAQNILPLPTAAEYLTRQGLDQTTADAMAKRVGGPGNILVMPAENMRGLAREIERFAANSNDSDVMTSQNKLAFSLGVEETLNSNTPYALVYPSGRMIGAQKAHCLIKPVHPEKSAQDLASLFLRVPANVIENPLLSKREMHILFNIHELVHCHPRNILKNPKGEHEIDADMASIHEASAIIGRDLTADLIALRLLADKFDEDDEGRAPDNHSSALFLSAQRSGQTLRWSNIDAVYAQLHSILKPSRQRSETLRNAHPFLRNAILFQQALNNPPEQILPLTREYMTLYVDAAQRIAPRAYSRLAETHLPKAKPATNAAGPALN